MQGEKRARRSRPGAPARISTGVPGLDAVLDGGLLRGGLYLLAGAPGSGKTVLSSQLCFSEAARGEHTAFLTLLTETHARLLANLSTFSFFKPELVGERVHLISGLGPLGDTGTERLYRLIEHELRHKFASVLIIDGAVALFEDVPSSAEFRSFLNRLKVLLEVCDSTAVLCLPSIRDRDDPVHAMADGLFVLKTEEVGLRSVRTLHVRKFRGSAHLEGLHIFEIDERGIVIHPRTESLLRQPSAMPRRAVARASFGIPGLDEMLRGGLLEGSTTGIIGAPGSGKTLLGMSFLAEGASRGERGLLVSFFESPDRVAGQASGIGMPIDRLTGEGLVDIIWASPTELSVDAIVSELLAHVKSRSIRRLFIDSADGFERASAFPERVPAVLSALCDELRGQNVTTLLAVEAPTIGLRGEPPDPLSAMFENTILLRYVELRSHIYRLISIVKARFSDHETSIRELSISASGISIASTFESAEAILSGTARLSGLETEAGGSAGGRDP
jgi:circadian clock protein KaiC